MRVEEFFSTQQIAKAKDQIIGSYLKLHSLLSLLQSYNPEEWIIKGIIASFAPDTEQQALLSRQKEAGNKICNLCYNLHRDKILHAGKQLQEILFPDECTGTDIALRSRTRQKSKLYS